MARVSPRLKNYARSMRRDSTLAEYVLWQELRDSQLGHRFRRQEPIGPFIVDFVCKRRSLVIELDGGSHESLERDHARDRSLTALGFFTLHFDNDDILWRLEEAVDLILLALADRTTVDDPANILR